MKPSLVVMAAGMGSRYGGGGLKQIEAVGPSGELLLDYAVYDALSAGFGRIVFVIKQEFQKAFREAIGKRMEAVADVAYVFQDMTDIPSALPAGLVRTKPWGTAHAVLAARVAVNGPFAVITADDFQGPTAFRMLANFLRGTHLESDAKNHYAMVGFQLGQTLSETGSVSRGVCQVSGGYLTHIAERKGISRTPSGIVCADGLGAEPLPPEAIVSMSAWAFTPEFFAEAQEGMRCFIEQHRDDAEAILNNEFYIPSLVNGMIRGGRARVRVFIAPERWCGITNPGDKPLVVGIVREMVHNGLYPERLWA